MPILELEFEVFCSCGNGLCRQTTEGKNNRNPFITVEPCQKCLDDIEQKGYDKGYDKGFDEGRQADEV